MLYRITFAVWCLMVLIILSIQGISRFRDGHLFIYSDLEANRVIILDTETLLDVSYPVRLAYQDVAGDIVGARFYLERSINYPPEVIQFVFNSSAMDVVSDEGRALLDTFVLAIADSGYWLASPDNSQIAYISIIEGKTYFAVLNRGGEFIVPLREMPINGNRLIWSGDSQQIYILNLSEGKVLAYEYDFARDSLSDEQLWLENTDRAYPSPAGGQLLYFHDDALYSYDISTGRGEVILTNEAVLSADSSQLELIWDYDGEAFLLAQSVTESDIELDVFSNNGTILYQDIVSLPYTSPGLADILFSSDSFIASISTPGYPLCLYYFKSSYLHCLSGGNFINPITFSTK